MRLAQLILFILTTVMLMLAVILYFIRGCRGYSKIFDILSLIIFNVGILFFLFGDPGKLSSNGVLAMYCFLFISSILLTLMRIITVSIRVRRR